MLMSHRVADLAYVPIVFLSTLLLASLQSESCHGSSHGFAQSPCLSSTFANPLFALLLRCVQGDLVFEHDRSHPHLPPHLRELCSILAAALVRHRCRTAEELARDAAQPGPDGETSLHFTAHQSGHADAPSRRHA